MLIALCLLSVVAAQEPDPAQEQVDQLEKIVRALEEVHPEIVAAVKHEEYEKRCHSALVAVDNSTAKQLAECIKAVKGHQVDINSNDAVLKDLRTRFPHEMARRNDVFWRMSLDAARIEYLRGLGT